MHSHKGEAGKRASKTGGVSDVTFSDVAGMDQVKLELEEV